MQGSDSKALHHFYHTPLGAVARKQLRQAIRTMWPSIYDASSASTRNTVIGVGYVSPFLTGCANACAAVAQGTHETWPSVSSNRLLLSEITTLPFEDCSIDHVLVAHALEFSDQHRDFLRELWRVLAPQGRLLLVVPNRLSIWARTERTPFGHGHPFTIKQCEALLRDVMFAPIQTKTALFVPPVQSHFCLRISQWFDRRWMKTLGGVLIIEAEKQLYAGITEVATKKHFSYAST